MDGFASTRTTWIGGGAVAAAIVIVVAIAVGGGGDDDATSVAPSTARPGVIGDTELLPLPGLAEPAPAPTLALPVGPEATSSQQRSLFEAPSDTARAASIGFKSFDDAIRKLTLAAPLRSSTRIEIGAGGFVFTVDGEHTGDGRYSFTIGGERQEADDVLVVDLDAGTTTLRPASGRGPEVVPNDEFADDLGAIDIEMLLQQLLLGPIRPQTMPFAGDVVAGPVVNVATNPDPFGRRFMVELPAAAIREWVPYLLGPTGEAPIADDATLVRFEVDVSGRAEIVRVSAEIPYGATVQRIEQRFGWEPAASSGATTSSTTAAPDRPTTPITPTTAPPG